jgi:hypothetical protein
VPHFSTPKLNVRRVSGKANALVERGVLQGANQRETDFFEVSHELGSPCNSDLTKRRIDLFYYGSAILGS